MKPFARTLFRSLVAAALLTGPAAFAQTQSSVADTDPRDYNTSSPKADMRQEATRIMQNGVVLVRLPADKGDFNDRLRKAFRERFTLAPVYFFPASEGKAVQDGNFGSLEAAVAQPSRSAQAANYVIVDVDSKNGAFAISNPQNDVLWRSASASARTTTTAGAQVDVDRAVQRLNERLYRFATGKGAPGQ